MYDTPSDTAAALGHADYWLFLAGFGLAWLAWNGLRARRGGTAGGPWIWLVWSAALAGAWHWQQFLLGCFGDSQAATLAGDGALVAVPVLYLEFARRSAQITGSLGTVITHAWPVAAGISLVAVIAHDAESTVMTAGVLGVACCLVGLAAAKRLANTASVEGRAMRLAVGATALLFLHVTVAGPLHGTSSYVETIATKTSAVAFAITAVLAAASAWWLGECLAARSERRPVRGVAIVIASVLLMGWIGVVEVGTAADSAFRGEMKSRVLSAASGLDPALVAALAGNQTDLQTPQYRVLKRMLIKLVTADPTNSFAYVMALRDGRVVFLADAEPDVSPDASLPGDVYESASAAMLEALNSGEPLVEGPSSDEWGTWISAFAPIRAPGVTRPLALLGLDADTRLWKSSLSRARVWVVMLVLLLCLATAAVGTAQRHSMDQALAASRRQYESLVQGSPTMVALLDVRGNVISLNARGREFLGLGDEQIAQTAFQHLWPVDVRPTVMEGIEAGAKGESGSYEVTVPGPDGPRHLALAVRPVRDPGRRTASVATPASGGGIEGIICTGSDVSQLVNARTQVQAQAAFLQGLLDTMPHFITAMDLEGRFTCCNLAAARFLRLDPEEILGKTAHEIFPREVADELTSSEDQLLATGGRAVHEVQLAGPDGQLRDVLYTKGLYCDADGKPTGFVGVGFDITERKQTEKLLRDSEERLRAIADAAMDAVIMVDDRGRIAFWNASATAMFGYTEEEALGNPVHDLLAPPRLRSTASAGLEYFHRTGTGPAVGKVSELQALRRNGEEFTVELSVAPVRIGQNWHAVGILRDITERQAAEEQRRLLAEVVQQSEAGVLIVDPMGRPMYANAAFERMRGLPAGECWPGTAALSILPDASLTEAIEHIMSGGDFWHAVVNAERADGGRYRAEVHAFPVRQPSGELGAIVCTQRDVSKEEALEVQLRQAQKLTAIGQLAAGIAHEINTPIQYVADNTRFLQSSFSHVLDLIRSTQDFTEVAEQRGLTSDEVAALRAEIERVDVPFLAREIPQAAQEALEGLDQVAKIVRAMKEFSHPGGSEMQPTDINAAVSATLTVSRNVWKYVADLESDLAEDLPTVDCQPGDINQIVLNLVVNAAQAIEERVGPGTDEKGTITVRTSATTEYVIVTVTDNGCGIPKEIRDRIFEPFFTTKEVGKGTGQGLWIAHSLTEKHGGTLTFVSDPGKGTTFTLALPITRHEAGSQEVA